jgi:hypothetical protein
MKKEGFTTEARSHGGAVLLRRGPTRGMLFRFDFLSALTALLRAKSAKGAKSAKRIIL